MVNHAISVHKQKTLTAPKIEASGENLLLPKQNKDDIDFTKYRLVSGSRSVFPDSVVSHDGRGRRIRLRFDMKKLYSGFSHLIAQDASGLHSGYHGSNAITVKFQKHMDFDISLAYSLPIILHDNVIPKYMGRVWPLSAMLRMLFIPFKHS